MERSEEKGVGEKEMAALALRITEEGQSAGRQLVTPALVEKVLDICTKRLAVEPGNAQLWARRAWACNALRRPHEALANARRALSCVEGVKQVPAPSRHPVERGVWLNLGFALLQLGDADEAIRCYAKAAAIGADPQLCGRMRERCLEYSASVALATSASPTASPTASPPRESDDDSRADDADGDVEKHRTQQPVVELLGIFKKSTPAVLSATKKKLSSSLSLSSSSSSSSSSSRTLAEECELLISLQRSGASKEQPSPTKDKKPTLAISTRAADVSPVVVAAVTWSPTGVNESPIGIEDGRPYQPYSAAFGDQKKTIRLGGGGGGDLSPNTSVKRDADTVEDPTSAKRVRFDDMSSRTALRVL